MELLEAATFAQTMEMAQTHHDLDLIILDLRMPGGSYRDTIASLITYAEMTPIIVISAYQSPEIIQSVLDLGVKGFLPKSSDCKMMQQAISLVLGGEIFIPNEAAGHNQRLDGVALTQRQKQVLALLGEGLCNKDICRRLDISERTVKMHISALMEKFDVHNRTQIAIKGIAGQF